MAVGKNLKASQSQTQVESNELIQSTDDLDQVAYESESEYEEMERVETQLFCVFNTGRADYAIPMDYVKEVVKMPSTTPIPQMPAYISSMANIRGEVYGIMNLSVFFQNDSQSEDYNYLLVLNDDEYKVAIALTDVPNTLKVSENMIEELSSSTFGSLEGKKYLSGIVRKGKQMIILFDVKGMISSEKFTEVSFDN